MRDLVYSDDPATMCVPKKKGKCAGCFGTHITKSVVVIYHINYALYRIYLVEMGGHKETYGRDTRAAILHRAEGGSGEVTPVRSRACGAGTSVQFAAGVPAPPHPPS